MTMHLVGPYMTTTNYKKRKKKNPTKSQLQALEVQWRQHNKEMRRKNLHSLQHETFDDYLAYLRGEYKPKANRKEEKEFKSYETPKSFVRHTESYPSLKTSDAIPGLCAKRESPQYTGDLIVGIATMHKSNAVPVMRDTEQAKEIASMRR